MQKLVSFKNQKGETLRGVVHVPKGYNPKSGTALVSLHGFPGSCFGDRSQRMANIFEKKGILFLRFDFSGSNTSDGRFEDKLMSQEVKEIKYAIDFLEKHFGFKKLILLGHSTGAIDASLYAYRDKRISKLILSGVVSDLKHGVNYDFNPAQIREFWIKGHITYKKKKGKKRWYFGKSLRKAFYDEFFTLDIPGSMRKYRRPVLIIHGEKDEAIPSSKDPHELYELANRPKKLIIIKNAGHSYDGRKQTKEYHEALLRFIK